MENTVPKNFGCSLLCFGAGVLGLVHLLFCYLYPQSWFQSGAVVAAEAATTSGTLGLAVAFMAVLLLYSRRGLPGPIALGFTLLVGLVGGYYWVTTFPELLQEATSKLNAGVFTRADYSAVQGFAYAGLLLMLALLVGTYVLLMSSRRKKRAEVKHL